MDVSLCSPCAGSYTGGGGGGGGGSRGLVKLPLSLANEIQLG